METDIYTRHKVLLAVGAPSAAVTKTNSNMQIVMLANISVCFMRHIETLQRAGSFSWLVKVNVGILVLQISCAGGVCMQGR